MSVVKEIINGKVEGYNVNVKCEFNTQDIGMSITVEAKWGFFEKSALGKLWIDKVTDLMDKIIDDLKKELPSEVFTKLQKRDFYEFDIYCPAITEVKYPSNNVMEAKMVFCADGKLKLFFDDTPIKTKYLPKEAIERISRVFRDRFIHGKC